MTAPTNRRALYLLFRRTYSYFDADFLRSLLAHLRTVLAQEGSGPEWASVACVAGIIRRELRRRSA